MKKLLLIIPLLASCGEYEKAPNGAFIESVKPKQEAPQPTSFYREVLEVEGHRYLAITGTYNGLQADTRAGVSIVHLESCPCKNH